MDEAQRAAALAEDKRNKKLAKQMLLSGKARRRQELENARLAYNAKVRLASEVGVLRRNAYLKAQMELLAPFVMGAKRSLQHQLGMISKEEAEKGPQGRKPRETRESRYLASLTPAKHGGEDADAPMDDAGASSADGGRSTTPIPDEEAVGDLGDLARTPEALEAFGALPAADFTADEIANFGWLEATLQPHQVIGLNWMLDAYRNGINGILADEMGLGKTVQTISYLGTLKNECGLHGPSLVVAPLSVLSSWVNEFKRFAPTLKVVRLHSGDRDERELMRTELLADVSNFDVVVTTYEMACSQNMKQVLCHKIHWRVLVLDEGHRIKNEKTILYERLRLVKAQRKLLLTGTPLQNNLHELWALLHFLHPELFADSQTFDQAFNLQRGQVDERVIAKCGQLLNAFMLRRLKRDVLATLPSKTEVLVYVPMSQTQTELSRQLLVSGAQVLGALAMATDEGKDQSAAAEKDWTQVQSLLLSLRKCCNHPQLFGSWMGEVASQVGEDLATSSGKLATLGLLLEQLLPAGHRVVLFSGWTSMLDLIEAFLQSKDIQFCRLDGSTNRVQRQIDIKQFNQPGSSLSVFLCSTRAGGLGITLTSADTVVIYDSDFNPQVDLQAMDRVHRIGQTKKVRVLRLVTHDSVEERIVQRARDKLFLMQRTMAAGDEEKEKDPNAVDAPASKMSRSEAIKLLQYGVAGAVNAQKAGIDTSVTSSQVAKVLKDVTAAMDKSEASVTIGVGGRLPSQPASKEALAAAAKAIGASEGGEERGRGRPSRGSSGGGASSKSLVNELDEDRVDTAELKSVADALGRTQRERTSRFIQVREDLTIPPLVPRVMPS